jgi:hypothetical protein
VAILTVSRQYACGGREIGRIVAERLGYRYEDRETVLAAMRAIDPRWARWGEDYDERRPSLWERYDWSFRGYAALLQRHLLEAAAAGRVVIVGRGGNFLLDGVPTALRVRVTAPRAERVERAMAREQGDRDAARRLLEETDRGRAGFIRAVYGRDWDDPAGYDRSYDTGGIAVADVVTDVLRLLGERDAADREAAARELALRVATARVRAALCVDEGLQLPTLEVLAEGGAVRVRAVVHSPGERQRVTEVATGPAGDLPVRFDLRFR